MHVDPDGEVGHELPDELGGAPILSISGRLVEGCGVVGIAGELDLNGTEQLLGTVDELLDDGSLTALTLDMRDVRFIDSSGLQAVLHVREAAHRAETELRLLLSPAVTRVIDLAELTDLLLAYVAPDPGPGSSS